MPDPLSTTILAAVGGAATKELVTKAWDSGKKWLSSFFENHQPEARQAAEENASEFLNDLATRLDRLETENPYNKEFFSKAFKEPSFSVLLQKAILNSAQTKSAEKHQLLSKLISDKLTAKEESIRSLAAQMACDAIAYATISQLKALAVACNLRLVTPNFTIRGTVTESMFQAACEDFVVKRFTPLSDVTMNALDLAHLEALSCLKVHSFMTFDLNQFLQQWHYGNYRYTSEQLAKTSIGSHLVNMWNEGGLRMTTPTSVGILVGTCVTSTLSGVKTNLSQEWD